MLQTTLDIEVEKLQKLAERSEEIGDYQTEYLCLKRILEISDVHAGQDENLATLLCDLALVCLSLDYIDEASKHLQSALEIHEGLKPVNHFTVQEIKTMIKNPESFYNEIQDLLNSSGRGKRIVSFEVSDSLSNFDLRTAQ